MPSVIEASCALYVGRGEESEKTNAQVEATVGAPRALLRLRDSSFWREAVRFQVPLPKLLTKGQNNRISHEVHFGVHGYNLHHQ